MKVALSNRQSWFLVIVVIAIGIIFNLIQLTNEHSYGDFSLYLMQAKTLVNESNYYLLELNQYALDHSQRPRGPYLYPWGLPVLLSPVLYFFGENLMAIKVVMVLGFAGALLMIYKLFKNKLGHEKTILIVAIFAFNTFFLFYTNYIMADLPFFFIALLTLFLMQKVVQNGQMPYSWLPFLLGFLIYFSYLTRTNGIVFLPLLFLCQIILWQQNKLSITSKFVIYNLAPYVAFFVFKYLGTLYFPELSGDNSHMGRLDMVNVNTIVHNTIYYLKLPSTFFPTSMGGLIYFLSIPLVIAGMMASYKRDYLYILFIVFTFGVFIIWPYTQGLRFLFPILPLYFYFLFYGFTWAENYFKRLPKNALVYPFAIILILLFTAAQFKRIVTNEEMAFHGPYNDDGREIMTFIKTKTSKDDIIIFGWPRAIVNITGRRSILEERPEKVYMMHDSYIILDKVQLKDQIDLSDIDHRFIPLLENREYSVFKIDTLNTKYLDYNQ